MTHWHAVAYASSPGSQPFNLSHTAANSSYRSRWEAGMMSTPASEGPQKPVRPSSSRSTRYPPAGGDHFSAWGDAVLLSRADYEALAGEPGPSAPSAPPTPGISWRAWPKPDPGNAKSTTWTEGEAVLHAQSLGRLPVLAKDRSRHAQAPQPAAGRGRLREPTSGHRETGATTPPVGRGLVEPHHRRASVGVPDRRRRHRRALQARYHYR